MLPAAALLLTAASCSNGSTERPAPEIPLSGSESGEACLAWMQETLPECPEFEAWQDSTGILPPDFEALPRTNLLPDPFTFFDGGKVKVDVSDWELRRKELLSLFEDCMWGHFPPKPEISRVEVLEEDAGEGWKSRTVKLLFGPEDKGSVRVKLTIPVGAPSPDGKYPLMLSTTLDGQGNVLLSRGYISAGFAGSDFMDDSASLPELYPDYDFAKLPRRAWLVSIVLDYFETVPEVDMDRIAVYGYSRDGKMMSIAAARDERISALVAGSTGVGGFVPWRYSGERNGGESIESTTRMFPDWFIPQLRYFSGREDRLPVAATLLLAVIAPRAGQFGFSDREWKYEPAYSWNFDEWKNRSGVSLDPLDWPEHQDAAVADIRDWESRREDIRASVEDMLGEKPVRLEARPSARALRSRSGAGAGPMEFSDMPYNPGQLEPDVPAWVIKRSSPEFGWTAEDAAGVSSRRISFGPDRLQADLYYPSDLAEGEKLPAVIWLHGFHYPLGYMWVYRRDINPILALAREGYAVLAFDQTGFGSRWDEYADFYERWPEWSRLGRMVCDVEDAVTALEGQSMVDSTNISLFGFAMGGTVGLYAAALDDRIDNVVSVCGFTPMRSDTPDRNMSGMTRYSHLYAMLPKLGFFEGNESRLPYDFEDLIAMTAPRGVLIVQPEMDRDASASDVRKAVSDAAAIYGLYGAEDQLGLQQPEDIGRMSISTQINAIKWLKEHTK